MLHRALVSRAVLAGVIIAAAALPFAGAPAPAVASGAAVTYTGTVKIDNSTSGVAVPLPVTITLQDHRVTDYDFSASLRCTDGSISNVGVNYAQLSTAPIPFSGHHFAVTVGNASTGIGLTAHITGTVTPGHKVAGHIRVEAHADSGVAPSGPLCSAAYHWVARAQRPVVAPTPTPTPAAPTVDLTLIPVREPLTASTYQYGIAVSNVACSGGAVAFSVSAAGHSATLTCAQTVPHPLTNAFFGLDAGSSYKVTVQPLVRAGSGYAPKGSPSQREVAVPAAGSSSWHPIAGA